MALPIMAKATAVWLVDNTTLTFDQIAKLCQLHSLEIQAIANDEVSSGIIGLDPTYNGQLTREEIARCEADPNAELKLVIPDIPVSEAKPKGARYTPISKRNDKPDAIAWLLKNQEDLSDARNPVRILAPNASAIEQPHNNTLFSHDYTLHANETKPSSK